jgi:filamentous hemagglutinin family protein
VINKISFHKYWYFILLSLLSTATLGIIGFSGKKAFAQSSNIIPDNTLGAESSEVTENFQGLPIEVITGGAERGINLFHSFQEFNVSDGREAYFSSPNPEIQNILTRVTGGNPSEILGTLGTFGDSQPNFFLINPSGIVFGENASLDVGGSFVASTANGINLGETGLFSATEPEKSSLLSVEPSALFFNAVNNQAEIVNRSRATSTVLGFAENGNPNRPINGLRVLDGKSLLLVGGNVSLDNGRLFAPGGRVELGGLTEGGTVGLGVDGDISSLSFPDGVERGDVSLANGSGITTLAGGGGSIGVYARNINISGRSIIVAGIGRGLGTVDSQAGDVDLNATGVIKAGQVSIIGNTVRPKATGNSGNINVITDSLNLLDGSQITTSIFGKGNAGNVKVSANGSVSFVGGFRVSPVGSISVLGAGILTNVEAGGSGKAGNIEINAASLSLVDNGQIQTAIRDKFGSLLAGQGDAGNINIKVKDAVTIVGAKDGTGSAISSRTQPGTIGSGGNITINSGSFSLLNGAQISASSFGQGDSGNIQINAKNTINISGTDLETGFSSGVFSTTELGSTGTAGNTTLTTNTFRLSDGALVTARTRNDNSGGDIMVNANIFETLSGGQIISITKGNGSAGKIIINATERVLVSGSDSNFDKRIAEFPDLVGDFGATSTIGVSSFTSGTTGDIEINSPKITLDNGGKLDANSASGNGGNINLQVSDLLLLRRGAEISTNAGTAKQGGDGGNIDINSRIIVAVPQENSDITANAFEGKGGNINIDTQGIFGIEPAGAPIPGENDITASSELGITGNINLNAPDNSSIQNSLSDLQQNPIDTNALIANSCIARSRKQESTFNITGAGGLPQRPGDAAASNYPTGEVQNLSSKIQSSQWKRGEAIIEPQGVYELPSGKLILSRECD